LPVLVAGVEPQRQQQRHAFHLAVTYYSEEMLAEMETITNDYGVNSYKFFLAYNRVLRMYDDELLSVFERCKEIRALAQVHAENGDMVDAGQQRMVVQCVEIDDEHNRQKRARNGHGEATTFSQRTSPPHRSYIILGTEHLGPSCGPVYGKRHRCDQIHWLYRLHIKRGFEWVGLELPQLL
jgi:hypothetical protein